MDIDEKGEEKSDIASIVSGDAWEKDVVTYSFNETIPKSYYDLQESSDTNYTEGFTPLTNQQRDAADEIFSDLENYVAVDFQKVEDDGDIRMNMVDMDEVCRSLHSILVKSLTILGDVFYSTEFIN